MKTANENVMRALARVMARARAGDVEAVAIIACGADGVPEPSFGGEAELMPSINIGLDALKQQFVFRTMQTMDQPTTPIVRPAS